MSHRLLTQKKLVESQESDLQVTEDNGEGEWARLPVSEKSEIVSGWHKILEETTDWGAYDPRCAIYAGPVEQCGSLQIDAVRYGSAAIVESKPQNIGTRDSPRGATDESFRTWTIVVAGITE